MPERPTRLGELHLHRVRNPAPCPERDQLDQGARPEGYAWPCQVLCVRCGRVTTRRDPEGLPWCGGTVVTRDQRLAEIAPGRQVAR